MKYLSESDYVHGQAAVTGVLLANLGTPDAPDRASVRRYLKEFLSERLGPAVTFWIYAGICATGFTVLCLRLPETKGRTLEQIERELMG